MVAKNAPRNDTRHGGQAGTKYHEEGRQEAEGTMGGIGMLCHPAHVNQACVARPGFVVQ
jgi:hypothetical protein